MRPHSQLWHDNNFSIFRLLAPNFVCQHDPTSNLLPITSTLVGWCGQMQKMMEIGGGRGHVIFSVNLSFYWRSNSVQISRILGKFWGPRSVGWRGAGGGLEGRTDGVQQCNGGLEWCGLLVAVAILYGISFADSASMQDKLTWHCSMLLRSTTTGLEWW